MAVVVPVAVGPPNGPNPLMMSAPKPAVLVLPNAIPVALASSEITSPETVICPPGVKVWDPITKSEAAFSIMVDAPTVMTGGIVIKSDGGERLNAEPSMTTAVGDTGREKVVPETVNTPPGVRVWDPMMKSEATSCVMTVEPIVIVAGIVVGSEGGGKFIVEPSMTIAVGIGRRE